MKTIKRYFAISETDNANLNMGIAIAESYDELICKIHEICVEHFDSEVQINTLSEDIYEAIRGGNNITIPILLSNDENEDGFYENITIILTQIY